ncbi:hypothetical protein BDZ94DRAFT_1254792 [Collybia nuda]|uniref:Ribosomal RNA methyltransferase FtsJ domain-containing protein n=1 Tax=Collybia nuda TaxID=64659 RepID=A0A9P6CLS4_9AGAR|nr:hypothetical protein BDZ94DRAFT_1254792 [Collybia nuda]
MSDIVVEFEDDRLGSLTKQLIALGAKNLERLVELREQSRNDESLTQIRTKEKNEAKTDNRTEKMKHDWYVGMRNGMREIDKKAKCVNVHDGFRFLDLGCCPGGFASYIMGQTEKSSAIGCKGVGISLPTEQAGYDLELSKKLRQSFEIHWADLTRYWLGPEDSPRSQESAGEFSELPPGITDKPFDFVILGASVIYSEVPDNRADIDRLLMAQLIIGFMTTRKGGTLIVKLAHIERVMTAKVLYLLHILSTEVWAVKPLRQHSKQPTFYAVAKGLGNGQQGGRVAEVVIGLRKLWCCLNFEGDLFMPAQLDFIITTKDLRDGKEGFLNRMVELGEEVCRVQVIGLQNATKHSKQHYQR